jgi:hypothetical protein
MISDFNGMDSGNINEDDLKNEITKALSNAGFTDVKFETKIQSGGADYVSYDAVKLLADMVADLSLELKEASNAIIKLKAELKAHTDITKYMLIEMKEMNFEINELKLPWYKKLIKAIRGYAS